MFPLGCGVIYPEAFLEEARGRYSFQREEPHCGPGQILPRGRCGCWAAPSCAPEDLLHACPRYLWCWSRAQHLSGFCGRWQASCFARGCYLGLHFFRSRQPPQQFHFSSSLCFHTRLSFHPPSSVLPLSHFTLLSLNNVCIFY